MNISIIGTGYVGLVTGACFARLGHTVTCVDIDKKKIETINSGISPIYEQGLDELLSTYKKNISAMTEYTNAILNSTITFICVGTPSKPNQGIDLTFIKEATTEIAQILKQKKQWHCVVVKSTVLPGTTKNIVLPLLEKYSGKKVGKDIGLAMNPEFLKEGVAIKDFMEPDRIVIGYFDEQSRSTLQDVYNNFSCPIVETSLSAAEMIKYASNAFLATKISFINEIGNLCKTLDIDTSEVAKGMGLDKRIGRPFLDSGIGWGGSCFPKDIDALIAWAKEIGEQAKILETVRAVNQQQPLRLLKILKKHLPNVKGKTIGLLGLSFKPNTDDIRESRAIPIVGELLKQGASIKAYDPQAMPNFKKQYPMITYCSTKDEILASDAILILTLWDEFKSMNFKGIIVIDGRGLNEAKKTAQIYEGVCW
jgi:UDPglucose 6-dehydrogenase